jgi:hypothetical protein
MKTLTHAAVIGLLALGVAGMPALAGEKKSTPSPLEAVKKELDVEAALRSGTPEALHVATMRKLWRSDKLFDAADPFVDQSIASAANVVASR